jgi:hypothetical protein
MIELVYMSRAKFMFQQAELDELLTNARFNNARLGITGLLLYDGLTTFIQAIEGERTQIDDLYHIISQDQRHGDIFQLAYTNIPCRSFPDWKMGFKRFNETDKTHLEGYSDFMQSGSEDATTYASFGLQMLNHFKTQTI